MEVATGFMSALVSVCSTLGRFAIPFSEPSVLVHLCRSCVVCHASGCVLCLSELSSLEIACSSFLIQELISLFRATRLRIMNARRLCASCLNFFRYVARNCLSFLIDLLNAAANLMHSLHRTLSPHSLDHSVHGGTCYMGAGYASPCGYNIAVRVRPHMGVHEGWVIPRWMTRRHGRAIPDKIPVREFLFAGGAGA